jgi:hypothetical protein
MKIRLMGAELFHADGQRDRVTDRRTDTTTLVVAICNFANSSKKGMNLCWDL